jgi:hypothetical protein
LPTRIEKYTVLKSPHVHKKHRAQYETRTHRRMVQFHRMSGTTASAFLDYVVRLCPPGIELRLAHTTVEAPSGELAKALGWEVSPDTSALSHEIRRVLQPGEVARLTDAMRAHAKGGGPNSFRTVPPSVFKHVRLTAGLRDFFSDSDKAAFDTVVDDVLSGRVPPPPPPPPPPTSSSPSSNSGSSSAVVEGSAVGDDVDSNERLEALKSSIEELDLLTREEIQSLSPHQLRELTEAAGIAVAGLVREEMESLSRRELQDLAKAAGIAANTKVRRFVR